METRRGRGVQGEALALAAQIAAGPTITMGEIKRLLRSTHDQMLDTQLKFAAVQFHAAPRRGIPRARFKPSWGAASRSLVGAKTIPGRVAAARGPTVQSFSLRRNSR